MAKVKLSELEKQAEKDWIPQQGDLYYWRETTTRHGNILTGIVESYDPQKKILRGILANHTHERKYLAEVFHINSKKLQIGE